MLISNAYRKSCVWFLWRFRKEWEIFWGKFVGTYGFSLIALYYESQRDIHVTDNKPFAKFLVSTEIPIISFGREFGTRKLFGSCYRVNVVNKRKHGVSKHRNNTDQLREGQISIQIWHSEDRASLDFLIIKANKMNYFSTSFWWRTLRVSDRLTVYHQES